MALQFVVGPAGGGKSTWLYDMLLHEAGKHREKKYIVLVPDQFTLETQKALVRKGGGILNIDVLSFHRLAYRVFEEMPALQKTELEDMGKLMLLRSVFREQKKNLHYFRRGLRGTGFLDECKSFLCELMQYRIGEDDFDAMEQGVGEGSLMALKIRDIRLIYRAFQEKLGERYRVAEELVPQLTSVAASVGMLRGAVVVLDGFTGFTPAQYELLRELLVIGEDMYVSVTTDRTEKRGAVFSLSRQTITRLSKLARDSGVLIREPVMTGKGREHISFRLADSPELSFLEGHLFAYDKAKFDMPVSSVSVVSCHRESEEAAYVAKSIYWLVEEGVCSYGDIAVVTSDTASYEQALRREMERLGIRYFMDYKKSIGANALAEYLLSFLHMYRRGFDYESTFRFLRSGLSPLSTEETDILENYVLARGRRGIRSYRQEWEYQVERMDLVQVNQFREKFLASIDGTVRKLSGGKKTVREFTEIIYQLIVQNKLYEKVQERSRRWEDEGNVVLAGEYRRTYRLLIEMFDELVELLGKELISFREYEELLSAGISGGLVGFIPPAANQVTIGDVKRTRLNNVKVLFFMGVTDDRIPAGKGTPGILSEQERKKILEQGVSLAPSPEEQALTEQFYMYLTLTKASEKLILTYAHIGEDGSSRRPAYLIAQICRMFPYLKIQEDAADTSLKAVLGCDKGRTYFLRRLQSGDFQNDRVFWELAAWYERKEPGCISRLLHGRGQGKAHSRLSMEMAEKLYGSELYGSVTRLEQFARCPYAFFLIYGLGLKEREQFQIGAVDYGNVFHALMEHFSHELGDRGWQDLSEEEALTLAGACADFVTDNYKGDMFHQSGRAEFMRERIKSISRASVWGIWKQMQAGDFRQCFTEQSFSGRDGLESLKIPLKDGKCLVLSGKIDRVDICETKDASLMKIMDYKSGGMDLDLCRVYHGLQLQLFTYMAAAMELYGERNPGSNPVPAALLYYRMEDPEVAWKDETEEDRRNRILSALKCKGYIVDSQGVLEKLDSGLVGGGRSALYPLGFKKDGSFDRYSHVMDNGQAMQMMRHVRTKMEEFGERIYAGEAGAIPYLMQTENGCEFCPFSEVCGIEEKQIRLCARALDKMTEEEVWEALNGKNQLDGGTTGDN